jgi:hypothetical protein
MKKMLVVVCLLMTSYCNARDFKFGVKTGLNFSNVVGDGSDGIINTRYYLGGFFNTPISKIILFQPELLLSMQGSKLDTGRSSVDYKVNTTYLNIPLLLKIRLGDWNRIHLFAGPQVGFPLKSEEIVTRGSRKEINDITKFVNAVDFSLNLGFSFNVRKNLALDLRYNRGFSKVYEFEGDIEDLEDEDYNSVIQLGASYSF